MSNTMCNSGIYNMQKLYCLLFSSADVQDPCTTPTKRKRISETPVESPSTRRRYVIFEDPNAPSQVNNLACSKAEYYEI